MRKQTRSQRQPNLPQPDPAPDDTIRVTWCFFAPEGLNRVFKPRPIKIPRQLYEDSAQKCRSLFCQELLAEYEFRVKLNSIGFWRPNTPLPDNAKRQAWEVFLNEDNRLTIPLSRPFSTEITDVKTKGIVHLIVTAAAEEENEEVSALPEGKLYDYRRKRFKKKKSSPPSDLAKPSTFSLLQKDDSKCYYCSRPSHKENLVPLALLDPVFGQFVDDCKNVNLTAEDMHFANKLRVAMSDYFHDERARGRELNSLLEEYGIPVGVKPKYKGTYEVDGWVSCGKHPISLFEIKNEPFNISSEPMIQVLLYFEEIVQEYSLWEDLSSCHPCLYIIVMGAYIVFGGCALTSHVISECFSLLPLAFHYTDDTAYEKLARHLVALKNAVTALTNRYAEQSPVGSSVSRRVSDIFPYKRTFRNFAKSNPSTTAFSYEKQRDNLLLFDGKTEGGDSICVKFVRKYGQRAHELCAENGFAPKLLGLEELPGGWLMVVMERLDERWTCLWDLEKPLKKQQATALKEGIQACLTLLHANGMVHGDVRDTNVLWKEDDSSFRLVDFDWAGKIGEARYPKLLNVDPELGRPDGAKDFEIIKAEHDMHMLEGLKGCRAAGTKA